MPTKPRGVLARVLMTVLSLALVVGVILAAQPAGAAGRRPDALADAASAALAALGQRRQAYAAVAESVLERGDRAVVGAETVFAQARLAVALHAAPRAGLDPAALDAVWSATADQRMVAVFAALSQVGVPYRRNSSNPGVSFDCSGLTTYAWGVAGVSLPRSSGSQISSVPNKPLAAVEPGDLVQYPGHVMMSLGLGTAIVHAPQSGKTVEVKAWSKARRAGNPLG